MLKLKRRKKGNKDFMEDDEYSKRFDMFTDDITKLIKDLNAKIDA